MRLKSVIWVQAIIKRAEGGGAFATILHKGEANAGAIVVVVDDGQVNSLYHQSRDWDTNELVWRKQAQPMDAQALSEVLARFRQRDPDLWVVEICDKSGRHFLSEPVIEEG